MSFLHKNLETKLQSINDDKSIEEETDFSIQPIKEETDTSIHGNILQTAKNASLSNKNKIKSSKRGQKIYKCPICNYSCSKKGNLKQHVESVHENKKSHKCPICDYSCAQKANLKRHVSSVHENKKTT